VVWFYLNSPVPTAADDNLRLINKDQQGGAFKGLEIPPVLWETDNQRGVIRGSAEYQNSPVLRIKPERPGYQVGSHIDVINTISVSFNINFIINFLTRMLQ